MHVASFKQFLATGRLGPISTDLNLRQVADLLGTPQDLIFNDDAPFYWIYSESDNDGPSLEICFYPDTPHPMYWFQIEDAGDVRHTFHLLGQSLAMTTDGFSGTSTPAEYIRSGAFDVGKTTIYLDDSFVLAIVTDRLVAFFCARDDGEDDMSDDQKRAIVDGFGTGLDFTARDRLYRVNSIYSYHEGSTKREWTDSPLTRATCSIPQYLEMIGDPPETAAHNG